MEAIATDTHTTIEMQPRLRNEPALAASGIQQTLVRSCEELELSYMHLPVGLVMMPRRWQPLPT